MIALDDVKAHLGGDADQWPEETVAQVLAAEHAAQRSVLDIPSPRPADVDEALLRRVEHNLRTTNGKPLTRVGIQGAGVRDLERPWSRRTSPDDGADTAPTKPRGAKKASAKKAAKAAQHQEEGNN